jgi:hypothetical protein
MTTNYRDLINRAEAAGRAAADAITPTPMIVRNDMTGETYAPVMGGVCGFAWIKIKPATTKFARWMKKEGIARTAYGGGLDIWISGYGQSMERKEAYAYAMANVLYEAGYNAYAESRMD